MKVLIVPHSYPPILGGLQTVVHHLAVGLTRKGYRVKVVTNRYPRSLPARETIEGVPVRRLLFLSPRWRYLRDRRVDLFLAGFYYFPVTLLKLTLLIRCFRPDVVNVHYPLSQIPFVLALRKRYRFRLVVSLHGDDILPWAKEGHSNSALRSILQQADAVTACSRWLLEQAQTWEPAVRSKGVVIHNGIELHRFADQQAYEYACPYLFAFGRLSYQKGFDLLLEAFARVAIAYSDLDLILAGEGEEKDALQAQVHQLGLEGRVHFFGRATPKEVVHLLNGCRGVVIPSRWEPFGITALEAVAAGKPIVATEVGGLLELLKRPGVRAVLVPPTVDGLARGMQEMLEGPETRSTRSEEDKVDLSYFSWERVVAQYEKVLGGERA